MEENHLDYAKNLNEFINENSSENISAKEREKHLFFNVSTQDLFLDLCF